MSILRYRLMPPKPVSAGQNRATPSAFDWISRVLVPLALAAIALLQTEQGRFLAILALAGLSFVVGAVGPVLQAARRRAGQTRDDWRARTLFRETCKFVGRFSEFVDKNKRLGPLEGIVQSELSQGARAALWERRFVANEIFHDMWYQLKVRTEKLVPGIESLDQCLYELDRVLNSYLTHHVAPSLKPWTGDTASPFTSDDLSKLEAFRERLLRFLDDYKEFRKRVTERITYRPMYPADLESLKPLPIRA